MWSSNHLVSSLMVWVIAVLQLTIHIVEQIKHSRADAHDSVAAEDAPASLALETDKASHAAPAVSLTSVLAKLFGDRNMQELFLRSACYG